MLAADDGEPPVRATGSGAAHAFSRPSRCASRCSQPSPSPDPMSTRAPRPGVPAARQIDHICAPERWAPKQDDGRAERRVRVRVAMVTRPRTVIDIGLRDQHRERPLCPVSRLGRSHLQAGPAWQVHGDPTYLIAADADIHPKDGDA
jgi:hypothetical protein